MKLKFLFLCLVAGVAGPVCRAEQIMQQAVEEQVNAVASVPVTQSNVPPANSPEVAKSIAEAAAALPATFRNRPLAVVPLVAAGPAIKGGLSDPAWQSATVLKMGLCSTGKDPLYPTEVRVLSTASAFYIGISAIDPAPKSLVTGSPFVYTNDACELFFFPGESARGQLYYQLAIDSANQVKGWHVHLVNGQGPSEDWTPKITHATKVNEHGYTAEIMLPYASMVFTDGAVAKKDLWRMNFCRTRQPRDNRPEERTAWSATGDREFHRANFFGYILNTAFATPDIVARLKAPDIKDLITADFQKQVNQWIADLGSDDWTTRNNAMDALKRIAMSSNPRSQFMTDLLSKALTAPDPEVAARAKRLLPLFQASEDSDLPIPQ